MVKNLIFFGAGASYGSDNKRLYDLGLLPPLGKNLFEKLIQNTKQNSWSNIPEKFHIPLKENFENGMKMVIQEFTQITSHKDFNNFNSVNYRELHNKLAHVNIYYLNAWMAFYFFKFEPQNNNLYVKLAKKIQEKNRISKWNGVFVTLNYDRLLYLAFKQLAVSNIEICYPHGACNIYMPNAIRMDESSFNPTNLIQNTQSDNYQIAESIHQLKSFPTPVLCHYEPSKSIQNGANFIQSQQERFAKLIEIAEKVIIVGVAVNEFDKHIWGNLLKAKKIYYFEPFLEPRNKFQYWAEKHNKKMLHDYEIIPKSFKEGFNQICELAL